LHGKLPRLVVASHRAQHTASAARCRSEQQDGAVVDDDLHSPVVLEASSSYWIACPVRCRRCRRIRSGRNEGERSSGRSASYASPCSPFPSSPRVLGPLAEGTFRYPGWLSFVAPLFSAPGSHAVELMFEKLAVNINCGLNARQASLLLERMSERQHNVATRLPLRGPGRHQGNLSCVFPTLRGAG